MASIYDFVELEAQLRAKIECDWSEGCLVTGRENRIHGKYYFSILGVTPSTGGRKLGHILKEYENRYQIITGPMRLLPRMRAWLEEQYQSKAIDFKGGKIDRRAFYNRFEVRDATLVVRNLEIRSLLHSFDERARTEKYLDAVSQLDLDRLREILSNNIIINKDRLTVNKLASWKLLAPMKLQRQHPAVDELFAEFEDVIRREALVSKIDPLCHGRRWNFNVDGRKDLEPFLCRVGEKTASYYSNKSYSLLKTAYSGFMVFMKWIINSDDDCCRMVLDEAVFTGIIKSERPWEDTLYKFREHLERQMRDQKTSLSTANETLIGLRGLTNVLVVQRVLPETLRPIQKFKSRRESTHLKSFAEASSTKTEQLDYLNFVRSTLRPYRSPENLGIAVDADNFMLSIARSAAERGSTDPSEAVLHVLRERRNAIQDAASSQVDRAMKAFSEGRALLESANIDVPEFVESYLAGNMTRYEAGKYVRKFFPRPSNILAEEQAKANFLKLVEVQFRGVIPPNGVRWSRGEWGKFFHHRLSELGGLETLEPMLGPTVEAVCAALTLYLIESGANVDVGRTLLRESIRPSDVPGHISVVGFKARAGGKPIFADLPNAGPAASALCWLRNAGLRIAATSDDPECLFNARFGDTVKVVEAFTYVEHFKKLLSNIPSMKHLRVVPNMIRPSVLLEAALANDGRMMLGVALGQHTLTVSQGYQQKYPVRAAYDANVHRFQSSVEQAILRGVPEAAHRLQMPEDVINARARELADTGLGTFCQSALGQTPEKRCASLSCWDSCPSMIIVARTEAIASLQIWRESLRSVAGDWERDQPHRWEKLWLPWLCLIDVVEEQMARGPNLKIWRDATEHAARLQEAPGFVAPRPW